MLVFDQFEEILTLDPLALDARREFFGQLGEALENPEVWALFALREDYLGALDPYRDDVPTRLSNTFRVDLLTVDAARDAIASPRTMPAASSHPTPRCKLANDLATISVQQPDGSFEQETGVYVEPLQLQVVCRRLWDELPADARTIGVENLPASGDVDAALAAYYDDSVAEIAGADGIRLWGSVMSSGAAAWPSRCTRKNRRGSPPPVPSCGIRRCCPRPARAPDALIDFAYRSPSLSKPHLHATGLGQG